MISATEPDWARERKASLFGWDPPRSLIASLRAYQHWRRHGNPLVRPLRMLAVLRYRFWSVVTGADIPLQCRIGGGLLMPHPNGIVIHSDAVLGPNCLVFQQVTIGGRGGEDSPVIGGHVDIGAGARILGGITIGDHCLIGANSVVIRDVPPWSVATGVPAVVRPRDREKLEGVALKAG